MLKPVTSPESSEQIIYQPLVTGWSTRMRNLFNSRKRIAVAAAGAVIVFGGVTALAYWSTTGSGTGSATAGTSKVLVSSDQDNTVTGLYPGDTAVPLTVKLVNGSGNGAVSIALVTPSIAHIKDHAGVTDAADCTVADFTLTAATHAPVVVVADGGNVAGVAGGTIAMNETSVNQDGCKDAVVSLTYAAS
jgi:hypothetical protein